MTRPKKARTLAPRQFKIKIRIVPAGKKPQPGQVLAEDKETAAWPGKTELLNIDSTRELNDQEPKGRLAMLNVTAGPRFTTERSSHDLF